MWVPYNRLSPTDPYVRTITVLELRGAKTILLLSTALGVRSSTFIDVPGPMAAAPPPIAVNVQLYSPGGERCLSVSADRSWTLERLLSEVNALTGLSSQHLQLRILSDAALGKRADAGVALLDGATLERTKAMAKATASTLPLEVMEALRQHELDYRERNGGVELDPKQLFPVDLVR